MKCIDISKKRLQCMKTNKLLKKKSSATLNEVFFSLRLFFFFGKGGLQGYLGLFLKKTKKQKQNICTIKSTLFEKHCQYKSLAVVLWHRKCSVACPLLSCIIIQWPSFMAPKYVPSPSGSSIHALDTLTNKASPSSSRTPRPCWAQYML